MDTQSQTTVLKTAEQNYISLLAKAGSPTEHQRIQESILETQKELATLQGRLEYLATVSAFSLINITLNLSPLDMKVDAGRDRDFQVGQPVYLDALITPPPDMTDFTYTWNFGDGSQERTGRTTALVADGSNTRKTNPVEYVYHRPGLHIVRVDVSASGKARRATGKDTFTVAVKDVPHIRLTLPFKNITATEGDKATLTARFNQPAGLHSYHYMVDFDDGTPTELRPVPQGVSHIDRNHHYDTPGTYQAHFLITAESDAGPVSAEDFMTIKVYPKDSVFAGNWDIGGWTKSGAKALFATLSIILRLVIWILIFSPFIIVAAVIYLFNRRLRQRQEQELIS